jgi:hypothetical protein
MVNHVTFGIGNVIAGILFVIFVGMSTIGSQTLKAAKANAARMLKFE